MNDEWWMNDEWMMNEWWWMMNDEWLMSEWWWMTVMWMVWMWCCVFVLSKFSLIHPLKGSFGTWWNIINAVCQLYRHIDLSGVMLFLSWILRAPKLHPEFRLCGWMLFLSSFWSEETMSGDREPKPYCLRDVLSTGFGTVTAILDILVKANLW